MTEVLRASIASKKFSGDLYLIHPIITRIGDANNKMDDAYAIMTEIINSPALTDEYLSSIAWSISQSASLTSEEKASLRALLAKEQAY